MQVGKTMFEMGALEGRNCVCEPIVQPPTINPQHSPSSHKHETFKELSQTLIGNPQSQTQCTNLSRALPASNLTYYIQLPRDIHEMSSNNAHPWCEALLYII